MAATNLPHLLDVERLSPLVVRVMGGNPGKFTLQGTNTYLLGSESSPVRLLIDTAQGLPSWISNLTAHLSASIPPEGSEPPIITRTFLTHIHHDHTGGIPDVISLCPHTQIHKHSAPYTPRRPDSSFPMASDSSAEQSLELLSSVAEKGHTIHPLSDDMAFSVPGTEGRVILSAVYTPGHTSDHTCFLLSDDGTGHPALFTGDTILGHGTAVFGDLGSYMASLRKMEKVCKDASAKAREPGQTVRGYPGHGAVIEDCTAKVTEYIKHREDRECEVVDTLAKGAEDGQKNGMTSMQIVKIVYKEYPVALHEPAEGSVLLLLWKLEGEGRVERVEGGESGKEKWRLVDGKEKEKIETKAAL